MSDLPSELKYAHSHEWARLEDDGTVVVGITDHAQEALGDLVFVELPDSESDEELDAGSGAAVVESVKAASDVYTPITGKVIEVNEALIDAPELVNESPYVDGWLFRIQPSDEAELEAMMDADSYADSIAED